MRRPVFNEYIENRQFRQMFISDMGWNNVHGQKEFPPYIIDDKEINIIAIAERNGFHILQCEVSEIPTSSFCKKLDLRLRRAANDYILIFFETNSLHHLWVAPVKKTEKRDLVFIEYSTLPQADFLYSKIDDLSFGMDERTTIMDVKERIQGAFMVNSEKLTKDFYSGFRKQHTSFTKFITGIDDEIAADKNRNKQWYASIMLNRLMFCYFIQKKGFLDNNTNYLGDKLSWVRREKGEDRFFHSFYRGFLTQLFHDGLNAPKHSVDFENTYGRIPYLNGGMFDEHQLEQDYSNIDIADEAFQNLFSFFDQWHWHLDDRHTASGKDINPDVLGYIFEQYINDRAAMGAYYTKEDITEYIGKNCILPFLMDKVKSSTQESEKNFRTNGYVWQTLAQSGDKYIYDAVKKGYSEDWQQRIPDYIAEGIDTSKPKLLDRRARWNEKTSDEFALPTEIWRETIERLQRCGNLIGKIRGGEITQINDFITYNLDIRQFVYDLLQNAQDHHFVAHFYHALQNVTILDPTCGSGAFLFAAMNILEPLYEVCIERMEEWNRSNPNLFKEELDEINRKYRSNRQYFIYKSIILRNLYGVDIMVEATEIAKLRLFLKMVAVVDVDLRADNLGLDPLPDIDFNIRCGNTLVGYATDEELEHDLTWGDMFANAEFREKVEEGMDKAARAFTQFKAVQFRQDEDMATFKQAKKELRKRLEILNDTLNHRLYSSTANAAALKYDDWKKSHQPFHWLAEFYEIIHGKGGFDVIIGNPPYVEISKTIKQYKLTNYKTITCGNLYACVYERSELISRTNSFVGMIVQLPIVCTDRMSQAQKLLLRRNSWTITFDDRPGKLFDDLQHIRVTIFITTSNLSKVYTSKYNRWYSECRNNLFKILTLVELKEINSICSIPKIGSQLAKSIIARMTNFRLLSINYSNKKDYTIYTHNAPQYFTRATDFIPFFWNEVDGEKISVSLKPYTFSSKEVSEIGCGILNSSIFYLWFIVLSDCRHLNAREIDNFPIGINEISNNIRQNICLLVKNLMNDYGNKKNRKESYYKSTGKVIYDEYYPKLSKSIIDEIDKVLAQHYGFTEEELDFIINYDIKYRMGDGLNEE